MNNISADKMHIFDDFKLPSSSYITCKNLTIGRGVIIDERTKIICPKGDIYIGDEVYIGNDVKIILNSFSIGEYTKLHNHCLINGKSDVTIGQNCWIGQNCIYNGEAKLTIGNNVGGGIYTTIWTHGYYGELIEGCTIYSVKPTTIEDDVWLMGSYNTIFPGVTIKRKSVLFGTSVVVKDMESNRVYGGNPAKDITDKIGLPYIEMDTSRKMDMIQKALKMYFLENDIEFKEVNNNFFLPAYGNVVFDNTDYDNRAISLIFSEEVVDWNTPLTCSMFCLKTKRYLKRYSKLEILIKRILNPATARFIPYSNEV